MGQPTQKQDLDPASPATPAEKNDDQPKTWWAKHSGLVILIGTGVLLVLLIVCNMK